MIESRRSIEDVQHYLMTIQQPQPQTENISSSLEKKKISDASNLQVESGGYN